MNNLLPLLTLLASKKDNGVSPQSLSPLLNTLGIDGETFTSLLSGISDGQPPSLEKLLPLALGMLGKAENQPISKPPADAQKIDAVPSTDSTTPYYLKPICNVANERINYALAHYFSNN